MLSSRELSLATEHSLWLNVESRLARIALFAAVVNLGVFLAIDFERDRFSALSPSVERPVEIKHWGRVARYHSPAMARYVRATFWAHFGFLGLAIAAEAAHRVRRRHAG